MFPPSNMSHVCLLCALPPHKTAIQFLVHKIANDYVAIPLMVSIRNARSARNVKVD